MALDDPVRAICGCFALMSVQMAPAACCDTVRQARIQEPGVAGFPIQEHCSAEAGILRQSGAEKIAFGISRIGGIFPVEGLTAEFGAEADEDGAGAPGFHPGRFAYPGANRT